MLTQKHTECLITVRTTCCGNLTAVSAEWRQGIVSSVEEDFTCITSAAGNTSVTTHITQFSSIRKEPVPHTISSTTSITITTWCQVSLADECLLLPLTNTVQQQDSVVSSVVGSIQLHL